jgi:hypothetical protein
MYEVFGLTRDNIIRNEICAVRGLAKTSIPPSDSEFARFFVHIGVSILQPAIT